MIRGVIAVEDDDFGDHGAPLEKRRSSNLAEKWLLFYIYRRWKRRAMRTVHPRGLPNVHPRGLPNLQ